MLQHFIYFHNTAKHYKENYLSGSWTSYSFFPLQCVFPRFQFGSQGGPKLLSIFIFQHGHVRGEPCFPGHQPPPLSRTLGLSGEGGTSPVPGHRAPRGSTALERWGDIGRPRGEAGRTGHGGHFRDKPTSQWAPYGTCAGTTGEEMLCLHSGSLAPRVEVLPAGGMTMRSSSPRVEGLSEKKRPCRSTARPETGPEGYSWAWPHQCPSALYCTQAGDIPTRCLERIQPNTCPSLAPTDAPGALPMGGESLGAGGWLSVLCNGSYSNV